jgi:hypothetical protein|tara:strand:+ start:909 stop:1487 length:579 start_codon:yes stop_codon:yes gene_type:complete
MAGKLFDKFEQEAFRAGITARTKASMKWFRDNVSNARVSRASLIADGPTRSGHQFGNMYNFMYDPKTKKSLPYYDRFPLCIPVQKAKGGFYGLNLHYLHPVIRAKFLDALYDITNNDKFDRTTKMKMSYSLLKSASNMRYFKPCFKHYLSEHVNSKLLLIEPADWEIAIFLPTESFRKVSKETVWKESRKMF